MRKTYLLSLLFLLASYAVEACNVIVTANDTTICVGQAAVLTANGATNYVWTPTGSTTASITVNPIVTTTYTVVGTGPANCNDTATITIYVTNYPNVTVSSPFDTICAGSNNTMTATGAAQFAWSPGSHSGNTFNPKPEVTTTYTIIGTNNPGGCKDTAYKTIYVKAAPKPLLSDLNPFSPFNNCSNTTGLPNYALSVTTTNNPVVNTYTLNWGDGSPVLNNLTYSDFNPSLNKTYNTFGVFNIQFTANYSNGCSRDTIIKVINQTNPSVGCTGPGNTQGCAPVQYWFKLTGYQQNSPGTIYVWNFGDGTSVTWNTVTVDSILHTFTQTSCTQPGGQFTVSVKAINSCDSTTATVNNVRVGTKPTAIFTLPDTTFCINVPVQPTNISIPAYNTPGCNINTVYSWNFGDPLGANNTSNLQTPPAHFYANPGTYTITLIASGNCGPDTMKKVVCIENNIVNFTLNNFNTCAPALVNLTNTSPNTDCSPTPYTWSITKLSNTCVPDSVNDFVLVSGNYTSNTPSFRFNNQGIYRIRLSHTNKCGLVFKDTIITIKRKPKITISAPTTICSNATINPTATILSCEGTLNPLSWSFPSATPNSSTSATPSFTAPVGTHTLTLSASNECGTTLQSHTIQVFAQPIIGITSSGGSAICIGQSTTLTANGGSNYVWTGGGAPVNNPSITVTPIVTTTYTVTVTSAQGCSNTATITITVNPLPSILLTSTPPTCVPGADGIILVSASNGLPTYTYQLNGNPFQVSPSFNGLTPNTYTITVKDANNCTKTSTQILSQTNPPVITSAPKVNVSCNGGNNGSIQINASGGTGSLTYIMQPGNISNNNGIFLGLIANTFTITVTDASGCTATTAVNITQPSVLNATLNASPVICNGQSNGSIISNANGGTPSYIYQLAPSGTTNGTGNFINLSAGTYTVTVTDSKNCTKTSSIVVTQPNALTWTNVSQQNVACYNIATGSITLALSGGVGTYQYTRQPGNVINTTGVYAGLSSGTYTITGRDANNCSISTVMTITQPTELLFTTNVFPPTCSPGGDATLSISANGGVPSYSYQLNGNPYATIATYTNLSAGSYTVNVKDSNNCIKSSVVNIVTPNAPSINNVNTTHVSCFGGSNGSIQVNASGGTGTLSYLLQPGPISNATGTFTGLTMNTYTVEVTDASGCFNTSVVQITQPAVLNAVLTPNSVSCFGQSNGSITTNATGGTTPYTYQLLPSGPSNSSGQYNGLPNGTYTVSVTDFKGCTKTATTIIIQPTLLTWTSSSTQPVVCFNGNTGSLSAVLSGGISPYNYSCLPNNTSNGSGTFNNLTAGTYTVVGTDANGCSKSTTLIITQPTQLNITSVSNTIPTCIPGNDATLSFSATGGITPYTYAISPLFTFGVNPSFTNLGAGTYTIQVKDANQCTHSATQVIAVPNAPTIQNLAVVNSTCNPGNNGSITVTASGGTGNLQYNIHTNPNVFVSSNVFSNLSNATYTITVKDASGCTSTSTATIITPSGPVINSIATINATCNPGCNGTIQVNATSAFLLQYRINNNPYQANSNFTGVCAGTYTITVRDANQCSVTSTVTINTNNTLVIVTDSVKNVTCNGANNGKIYLSATGAALPVNYTLQPGNTTNTNGDFINLSPAVYTITALDATGCSQSITIQITQPPALLISNTQSVNVLCFGGNNGSITISASGGTGTKTYTRQPGNQSNTSGLFSSLVAGTYTITVRDANLCSVSTVVTITQPTQVQISSISNTQPACVPANSATLSASATGGTAPYTYSIGGAFQASSSFPNLTPNTYTVSVSDANNCTVSSTWTIISPNAPQWTNAQVVPVVCFGQANGSVQVTAIGGVGTINYSAQPINQTNTSGLFTNLLAASYTITATDQLGCTNSTIALVNQPANLFFVSAVSNAVACNNGNTGGITTTVSGGVTPYNYTLLPNNTSNGVGVFSNLISGTYTIVVTDANACSKTTVLTISQPTPLQFNTVSINNVSCFGGNNGTLTRTASGGSGTITYTLNPGNMNNTTGAYTGLAAGIYTLVATDANACSISATHTITQATQLLIDTIISSAPSCAPMSLSVTVSGGTPSYTYAINGGASSPSNVFTNLGAGIYTISVVDANGCVKTATKTLVLPNQPFISSVSTLSPSCFGLSNGGITSVVPSGGASPYTLLVIPGGSFNNLTAGAYTVIATDANTCSATSIVNITQPSAVSLANAVSNQVLCHNQSNGSLTFTGSGGTGILTYTLINSGASNTNGQFNNLVGGTYTVQITDANNCTFTATQAVINPPPITFTSVSYTPITCNGLNNGSFVTLSGGGTGLLTYAIFPAVFPPNTTGIFNPLAANNYTVTVSDINNCTKDTALAVIQPPPVSGTFLIQNQVSCFGGQNAQFTVFANSGYAPFQFYLLGSPTVNTTGVFSNLSAGSYSVQIVDSAFCSTTIGPIVITQPNPIVWDSVYIPHIRCFGDLTDSLRVKASGGVGNFTYAVSPLGPQTTTTGQFANLTAQTYTVTATDASGCTTTTSVTITQNNAIVFPVFDIQYPACYGDSNGRIEVYASGGVPPLYYQLNGSAPSLNSVYGGLKAGSYTIRITDALNCVRDTTVLLTQLNQLQLTTLSVGPEICIEGNDATIYVQATGGVGSLVYGLLPDSVTNSTGLFTPLSAGTYTLLISDTAGCSLDTLVTVTSTLNPLEITITKNDLGCLGVGTEGYAIADVSGGAQPYTYLWNTNPPQETPKASDLRFGYYIVQVSDVKGCTISDTVYIEPGTCCEEVFIPSAFTPNGDGLNDVFRVVTSAGLQVIQFDVVNRWGEIVWSTDDYTKGWNGLHKGQAVGPNEVFFYVFAYRCLTDGKTYMRRGDVTAIR